jgi:hypothetical protein
LQEVTELEEFSIKLIIIKKSFKMIIEFWKTGENPILCYHSVKPKKEVVRVPKNIAKTKKISVTVVSLNGKKQEYESVVKAAEAVGVTKQFLYDYFNGRGKNSTEYQIYKS